MKQVNITVTDEEYEILVREAGKRMAISGKLTPISTLAHELLVPAISGLNGTQPIKEAHQDAPPIENPETNSKIVSGANDIANTDVADGAKSQLVQDFDKLDF